MLASPFSRPRGYDRRGQPTIAGEQADGAPSGWPRDVPRQDEKGGSGG